MSPGQQIMEIIFSSVETIFSGLLATLLSSLYASFIAPIFEAIALNLGLPVP